MARQRRTSARPWRCCRRTASWCRIAASTATRSTSTLSAVKNDTSELNVTVLTTLQCNFACDYCFQGDHGDYNKFADKMTLETAGRVADWIERELDRVRPEKFVLTFFGGEPLLNLPVMYYLAERLWRDAPVARRADGDQRHHQRPAAHARGRRSTAAVRPEGRQDHARRRSRHAQPDAAAARRPGHVRSHHREHPPRRRPRQHRHRRQLRRELGRQLIRRCSTSCSEQDFADKLVKVNFKPVVRNEQTPARRRRRRWRRACCR